MGIWIWSINGASNLVNLVVSVACPNATYEVGWSKYSLCRFKKAMDTVDNIYNILVTISKVAEYIYILNIYWIYILNIKGKPVYKCIQ